MTQVVPEHIARAKLIANTNNNVRKESTNSYKNRTHRSTPTTSTVISVTCDSDTPLRPYNMSHQKSSLKKPRTSKTNLAPSHSSSTLMNTSVHSPSTLFRNHRLYKSNGNSASSMSTSLTTTSGMNIVHERSTLSSSVSTISISNKHLIKTSGTGKNDNICGTMISTKTLSNKHKANSLDDDDHRHLRTNQNRTMGKSVLEHLVFVFPENVRRMLTGSKK